MVDPDGSAQSLAAYLRTLTREQIANLLTVRHDATLAPAPQTMAVLAARLLQPRSLGAAWMVLTRPQLQVAEAVAALGAACTPRRLATLLGVPHNDPDLAAVLAQLAALALTWPHAGGLASEHLSAVLPQPLGLGPGARELLESRSLSDLRRLAKTLGMPILRSKAEVVAALASRLADHDEVRRLAEQAPADTRAALDKLAWEQPSPFDMPLIFFGAPAVALRWAFDHGLVVQSAWNGAGLMPREVALALRGGDHRAPFDVRPPTPQVVPVPSSAVGREAAAAATATLESLTAVVEAMSRTPVAVLKTGGVGVRELRRIAKSAGQSEERTRLIVELVTAGGLVAASDAGIVPADAYDEFTSGEPARRLLDVVKIWLDMPACPYAPARPGEPAEPALSWDPDEEALLTGLRAATLSTLTTLIADGEAIDAGALADQLAWHRPALTEMIGDDLDRFTTGIWREAHEIGLLAHGAPSGLCRSLLSGDADALHAQATTMVPQTRETVLLQADLTAVVTGTPSAALLSLLDHAADPESRSGAWTWRFSPATIRRALDAGTDPQELLERLTDAAEGGRLPQPLAYLIDDAARRHGRVQVRPVGCCLCSDDEALLTEILSTRSLKALNLARLAPTVLASDKPSAETLAALRAAGYAPAATRADGSRSIELTPRHRAAAPADAFAPAGLDGDAGLIDPAKLADILLMGG